MSKGSVSVSFCLHLISRVLFSILWFPVIFVLENVQMLLLLQASLHLVRLPSSFTDQTWRLIALVKSSKSSSMCQYSWQNDWRLNGHILWGLCCHGKKNSCALGTPSLVSVQHLTQSYRWKINGNLSSFVWKCCCEACHHPFKNEGGRKKMFHPCLPTSVVMNEDGNSVNYQPSALSKKITLIWEDWEYTTEPTLNYS